MKIILTTVCFMLFFVFQAPDLVAGTWQEDQAEADQYYETGVYNKAFKIYLGLAKRGVSHSQAMVSQMYSDGEGTKMKANDAYAWAVLAAQRGASDLVERRDSLYEQSANQQSAQKKADKLLSKYGRDALKKKADSKAKLKQNTKSGGCTGSKLGCR